MDRRGFFKSLVASAVGLFVLPKNETNRTELCMNPVLGDGKQRSGTKFILAEPDPDMIIVSTTEWRGCIYIATQKGVYIIRDDHKLERLKFITKET